MKKIIFTFCFLLMAIGVSAQEQYTLKSGFPEGTYVFTQTNNWESDNPADKTKRTYTIKLTAESVTADGTQEVTVEITRETKEMELLGTIREKYDSDDHSKKNAESPLSGDGFFVGMKLTLTYDSNGKVTSVEGLDEFYDKKMKESPPSMQEKIGYWKQFKNAKAFVELLDMGTAFLPPVPVVVGDSWPTQTEFDMISEKSDPYPIDLPHPSLYPFPRWPH